MQTKVLMDVLRERQAQDQQWGGPDHDDNHDPVDWIDYVRKQLERANKTESLLVYRRCMVKIAALAIAALESLDRKEAY